MGLFEAGSCRTLSSEATTSVRTGMTSYQATCHASVEAGGTVSSGTEARTGGVASSVPRETIWQRVRAAAKVGLSLIFQ